MRIEHLELSRYGKFTAMPIPLPRGKHDFHLIVGPNEAGKSTIRDAILDLLFGIEMRSAYDFLHPKAEMCLAARLSHGERELDFRRVKKTRSLLDAAGAALADNALAPFLGNADRQFFDQMFGLDHDRLVSGGNEILKASNDVGRVLFQSAAGITSFGSVRDALDEEANKLWARRKSGDRAYYVAADELAEADASLKQAIVRTRDWSAARDKADEIAQQLAEVRQQFETLEAERMRLERVRRVAPALHACADNERQLASMGEVLRLPAEAARLLAEAETEEAIARVALELSGRQAAEAQRARAAISVDRALLARANDITALAARRQQTVHHERDIGRRELEIEGLWRDVQAALRQLGWAIGDEEALQAKLPTLLLRHRLDHLIKTHGALARAADASADAEKAKHREIADNAAERERTPVGSVSAELRAALEAALKLGDHTAARTREEARAARAQQDYRAAASALGAWGGELEALRRLALPALEVVRSLRSERERLQREQQLQAARQDELRGEIAAAALAIDQYQRAHRAVTADELAEARRQRDGLWASLRAGETALAVGAADYEGQVRHSDSLADLRHDKAQDAAELQARLDALARLQLGLNDGEARLQRLQAELAQRDAAWQEQAAALGFPDMPLAAHEPWQAALKQLLAAADEVERCDHEAAQLHARFTAAHERLGAALGGAAAPGADLDVLASTAQALLETATAARARREELDRQIANARAALEDLQQRSARASAELAAWHDDWTAATASAELADPSIPAVEAALQLFETIDERLTAIGELRRARIALMRRDLDDFDAEARALLGVLSPAWEARSAAEIADELATRLAAAQAAKTEAERLEAALQGFAQQLADAERRIEVARARVAPLARLAGSSDAETLRGLIARSDAQRRLEEAAGSARASALAHGDGLSFAPLAAEADDVDLAQLPLRLGEINRELAAARERQAGLAAAQATANGELGRISGSADAARAEAARQEALARMAEAAERFIKLHIAGKLLRWAIDRFRETRQGPLLARASEIFARLTLGSFARLIVDFDADPPRLEGLRPDGRAVGIPGMSDGTRDQLYLALRLAALELHIGQGHALPFIADDLFINYDDARSGAGLEALSELSRHTQVIFLSHHHHLIPSVRRVFGEAVNIVELST